MLDVMLRSKTSLPKDPADTEDGNVQSFIPFIADAVYALEVWPGVAFAMLVSSTESCFLGDSNCLALM